MNVLIKVINRRSDSITLDGGVELKAGEHEYKLKKEVADHIVRAASVINELEVQLVSQPSDLNPSTVDGKAELEKVSAENGKLAAELEKVSAENGKLAAELEKVSAKNGELAAELEKAKASASDEAENKKSAKTTKSKTDNKEK